MLNYSAITTKLHLIAYITTLKPINLVSTKPSLVVVHSIGYGNGGGYGAGNGSGTGYGDGEGSGEGSGDGGD